MPFRDKVVKELGRSSWRKAFLSMAFCLGPIFVILGILNILLPFSIFFVEKITLEVVGALVLLEIFGWTFLLYGYWGIRRGFKELNEGEYLGAIIPTLAILAVFSWKAYWGEINSLPGFIGAATAGVPMIAWSVYLVVRLIRNRKARKFDRETEKSILEEEARLILENDENRKLLEKGIEEAALGKTVPALKDEEMEFPNQGVKFGPSDRTKALDAKKKLPE